MGITCVRRGRQAQKVSDAVDGRVRRLGPVVAIDFETGDLKQRGTDWSVHIEADSFEEMALAMVNAAPDDAAAAFAWALSKRL
ncbi:hypothetical protein FJ942_09720 [Mesorhizobium sp. B2-4-2]|uniref:hypothetical protein n=1 Tax=unclassified Mesorhizobium TaxID=325217 RepID=UPI001127B5A4|nr:MULTISPECIES: hypothetical protein [unclassified Mesorhizobium]MBZ9956729.1 hypothetical protein [Mesorhizobium sp. BR1-1-14]TPL20605.1 hypothetical protein FJ952_10125 [Mesorhizobium sp. B2-4-10]TPL58931.1 hypothetical protein FJ942_09720 [Mesorhizobium sp. B2-4-2]TPN58025.1 hypothetical protein FJ981_08745 [Mesorhizobium sp. B1-1-4]